MPKERQAAGSGRNDVTIPDAEVGLCSSCERATVQPNPRGHAFWRCTGADDDPTLRRYPPLPVRSCHAFEAGEPRRRAP